MYFNIGIMVFHINVMYVEKYSVQRNQHVNGGREMSTYPTDLHTFRELLDDIDTAINLEDALEDEGVSDLLEEYMDKWNMKMKMEIEK